MKKLIALCATSALVAGCGGGGSSPEPAPAPAPAQLAAYVGVWQSGCDVREREIATFTLGASGALEISTKTEYFSLAGCTGTILGTETLSANFTASHAGTVDASVQLSANSAPTAIKVDKVNSSAPSLSMQIVGPGVVRTIKDGQPQWCIDFGGGSSTCIMDSGTQPAKTASGGLYLQGNQLFSLDPSGSSFAVDRIYTKK